MCMGRIPSCHLNSPWMYVSPEATLKCGFVKKGIHAKHISLVQKDQDDLFIEQNLGQPFYEGGITKTDPGICWWEAWIRSTPPSHGVFLFTNALQFKMVCWKGCPFLSRWSCAVLVSWSAGARNMKICGMRSMCTNASQYCICQSFHFTRMEGLNGFLWASSCLVWQYPRRISPEGAWPNLQFPLLLFIQLHLLHVYIKRYL